MGDTKKVKHAGRFGVRYGKGVRDRVILIEAKQRQLHECPSCGFKKVKRITTGLYKCGKCGFEFSGGAFTPTTMSGRIVKKMVAQKKFMPLVKELIELKEEQVKGLNEKKADAKEELKEKSEKKPKKAAKKKAVKKEKEEETEEVEEEVKEEVEEEVKEEVEEKVKEETVKEAPGKKE